MAKRPGKQIAEATAEPLTNQGRRSSRENREGQRRGSDRERQCLESRCSGADQGVSGIGDQECQEPDRCDAGAGRSEKSGGVHRIAAAADLKEGVEAAVSDSRHIAQLTTTVFTAAFEPVKKQIEAVQKTARPRPISNAFLRKSRSPSPIRSSCHASPP